MGGIVIGYEIGRLLKKETIFCERVNGTFKLRRGFNIKKKSKVLIVEDVITTGRSSLECEKLIKKAGGNLIGFSCMSRPRAHPAKPRCLTPLTINSHAFTLPKSTSCHYFPFLFRCRVLH